jgi:hypothetical protein
MKHYYYYLFALLFASNSFSQSLKDTIPHTKRVTSLAPGGATTTVRLPSGGDFDNYFRGAIIIKPSELTNATLSNLTAGRTITQIGYATVDSNFSTSPHSASQKADSLVTGTMTIYMQNTADSTFNKSGSWSTVLNSMTQVYSGPFIIYPDTFYEVMFFTNNAFVYTGGGLYIAYQYQKDAGSKSVSNYLNSNGTLSPKGPVYDANSLVTNSCFVNRSATAFPTTINASGSNFRPCLRVVHDLISDVKSVKKENEPFSISPNPNNGIFKLNTNNASIKAIKILDGVGKVIVSKSVEELNQDIDISKYPSGFYYLHVLQANTVSMMKFVKE